MIKEKEREKDSYADPCYPIKIPNLPQAAAQAPRAIHRWLKCRLVASRYRGEALAQCFGAPVTMVDIIDAYTAVPVPTPVHPDPLVDPPRCLATL